MSVKHRRYPLKAKEAKEILNDASKKLKICLEDLFGSKVVVEVVESSVGLIYLIAGKPVFFKTDSQILPTLLFSEFTSKAPKIVVDMGAIPYVCKGADVMAPGIVRCEGEFSKGDIVLVTDVKYGKPLALGEVLYGSEEARGVKQGPVVKTKHYVSDKVWDFIKTFSG